ncbi:ABC transporter permease [Ruminiclostridium cellobioparum]|uniref:ABC-type polysaccharide transport system, permease component n=1 Tax=Ruminiclostridium cellobioparum subsp. termitidis CT1112 TaxID=1195236 RepID=S0FHP9_RUMCE|nr:ABC transporter permease subunit [Ruminiclostridium cellobioparum]EMS71022.1 ABC-type polysaccharide transport system, permease component [Ruminiclostridium cellobioparum subsp. termitidis CT1112]
MFILSNMPVAQKRNLGTKRSGVLGLISRIWAQRDLQAMAIPGVIWMIIFNFIPMYFIIIAFMRYNVAKGVLGSKWVGFKNFTEFFADDRFWLVMKDTFGLNLLRLIIGFPIPILFAILLNELLSTRFKRFVQTVSYLPHFLSWIIVGGIMYNWLSDSGLITTLLVHVGLLKEPIHLIGTPQYFWGILITSETWKEIGWNAIIYIAAISGIDPSLFEAAVIDGAGRLRRVWNVILPSIKGTIAVLLVLNIGNLLGSNFEQLFVFYKPVLYDVIDVIDIYAYRLGIENGRLSYATAVGLFRSIFAFILLYTANKASKKLTDTSLV